nr:immunoglobulin heavy chain junction region [Macaca mulatta]MOX91777.1 immunoglobulin heavy chain junction region [Macaca mulatta]MOX91778.1 immunoglobulin heavy chain junction region [Macaca mulatta]MOX91876.1 immunoglobulin heavy chain junction region [Macaca mulatta]MOX91887.1 immunoglobulin heavy chain junction region [Macaca mulatta]
CASFSGYYRMIFDYW